MDKIQFLGMTHALISLAVLLLFTVNVLVEYVRTEGRCGMPFNKRNTWRFFHAAALLLALAVPHVGILGIVALVMNLVMGWFHRKWFPDYYVERD